MKNVPPLLGGMHKVNTNNNSLIINNMANYNNASIPMLKQAKVSTKSYGPI